jgi:membrane protease subunit (stomatin/prohibitin family)
VDAKAKTVGAVFVAVLDAEQVKQAKQLREQLGKSWTAGEVTAIKDLSITIKRVDDVSQTFTVDENTSFTKRKESITLGDIQVGDRLSAKGGLKDGTFVATSVTVGRMGMWPGGEGRGPGGAHGPGPSGTPPNQ